ncbi:hypothetical protein BDW42DRAFT_162547 [Aspergillus taichungensis]|uniref:C2H2 finger domain protein n=1 Tax=Aspergillus taichungensis TaxID=482145 RepID=A0A2J5I3J5_9EURO|nr:hypothetical protein BDW42DRAFT_162547 [Aspergillus taichungensis]
MGKKRRGPSLEELLARPWCYYCERDFDDLKILISHQKAKHFKCERCGRRLNTAGGLSVHMSQVHKEQLSTVDNALPNRSSLDVEIFGMEGVPEDIIQGHNQRVATQFQQAEVERQAVTGNPPAGQGGATPGGGQQPAKRPKLENVSDLKKRLAEHKAKKAEALAGGSSGDVTPVGAGQTTSIGFNASNPPAQQFSYPQPYTGAAAGSPYQSTASPVYQNFLPGGPQQYPSSTQYTSPSTYSPQPYTAPTPGQPIGYPSQPPSQTNTPPQTATGLPQRPPSLPSASTLPQRPVMGAPPVNAFQMQQMHMGQGGPNGEGTTPFATSVDDLISGAARAADQAAAPAATPASAPAPSKPEATDEKTTKKDKAKQTRLVYADNETSPEEKMARLSRYAYVPQEETVLAEVPAAVTAPNDTSM